MEFRVLGRSLSYYFTTDQFGAFPEFRVHRVGSDQEQLDTLELSVIGHPQHVIHKHGGRSQEISTFLQRYMELHVGSKRYKLILSLATTTDQKS